MDVPHFILIFTIIVALLFDVVNGFHDAANSIATVVSTQVLRPKTAVLWAAFFNFAAMFVFAPRVAETISKIVKIQPDDTIFIFVVLAGLLGAIIWDLLTWFWGLPSSSSHALIGGVGGAGLAYAGPDILHWNLVGITIIFIVIAPIFGFVLGFLIKLMLSWIFRYWSPSKVDKIFQKGQLVSAAMYSLGHGANDAQKTMGILLALLIASGNLAPETELSIMNPQTLWIILSCHLAMAIGTAFGGWRIVKTMGMKLTKLQPVGGFCAETAGALTLFMVTRWGIPVSTTHTINGAIIGVGSSTNALSGVRWGVARRIVWAWIFTIPASAILSAALFYIFLLFL